MELGWPTVGYTWNDLTIYIFCLFPFRSSHTAEYSSCRTSYLSSTMAEDIKAECRSGLDPKSRRDAWLGLTKAGSRADFYDAALEEVFGTALPKPAKVFRVSTEVFGIVQVYLVMLNCAHHVQSAIFAADTIFGRCSDGASRVGARTALSAIS